MSSKGPIFPQCNIINIIIINIIIITTKNNVQLELFLLKKIVQSGDAVKVDSQESNLHSFVDLVATVIAIHNLDHRSQSL